MKRVLLAAGTADARELAGRLLTEGFSLLATVATDQGEIFLPPHPGLEVRAGRLDESGLERLLVAEPFLAVVDATHPYADVVSDNLRRACEALGMPLFRLVRPETPLQGDVRFFADAAAAAAYLRDRSGRILLTVGSKELEPFAALPGAAERLVVRVLPDAKSLEKCQSLGLSTRSIVAMVGPFSQAMNEVLLRDSGARWLVTKDGGVQGGTPEKLAAAAAAGVPVLMLKRPPQGAGLSADEIIERLRELAPELLPKERRRLRPFPLFVNVESAVVVGGGPTAVRRAAKLLQFGASVRLVAPELCAPGRELLNNEMFLWEPRRWRAGDCRGVDLVLAATDDEEVNGHVEAEARSLGVPFNRADRHCGNDFLFPAIVDSPDAVAALSTDGRMPGLNSRLATRLRTVWNDWCDEEINALPLRAASRESTLAVAQSRIAIAAVERILKRKCDLLTMKTSGDKLLSRSLENVGGKGLFVKELERSLLDGRADFAVHSLKDVPEQMCEGLKLIAVLKRGDPRDCLVLPVGETRPLRRIGTSSKRRRLQAAALFPTSCFTPVRGNVQTRLRRLDEGAYDALILAVSGLQRLGLEGRISRIFAPDEIIPAAGQGTLALECRAGSRAEEMLQLVNDAETAARTAAERAFIAELDGGCSAPHAAYAVILDGTLRLLGLYVAPGGRLRRGETSGPVRLAEQIGRELACRLRDEENGG